VFVEELAEQGQDIGRLVTDLLEHLRHLLLVQHLGEVPETLPVTEETRERLREQANQLAEPTVLRLIDLLAVAVEDMRQGADPRLPLELALVKVTRPQADLARESLAYRVELLEGRSPPTGGQAPAQLHATQPAVESRDESIASEPSSRPPLELEQLQDAWHRTVLGAVRERSVPAAALLGEARPSSLDDDTLTLEFPAGAEFHRKQAEEGKNVGLLREALYAVTGRRLAIATAIAEGPRVEEPVDEPLSEDDVISLLKDTFDAKEVEETP
jgi:DNA polymerase-3 subunit gamma/tau